MSSLERFSFECQKIGFASTTLHEKLVLRQLRYMIELENFPPLHPVREKPIVARLHAFSRAFRQLHEILVLIGSLDCVSSLIE